MKKSTKSLAAAAGAVVLLTGGLGSLAFWSAETTVSAGAITSGKLTLEAGSCGEWKLGGTTDFTAATRIVPGDTATMLCEFGITAVGDNLSAKLTLEGGDAFTIKDANGATVTPAPTTTPAPAPTTAKLEAVPTFTVGTAAATAASIDTISSSDDGKKVFATITVTFPFGDDTTTNLNDSQGITATLADLTVVATQTNS